MQNHDEIIRYDEYIIRIEDDTYRLSGYQLPNGCFVVCYGNTTRLYSTFQTYRRRIGDILEAARLNGHETTFISGTTKLRPTK